METGREYFSKRKLCFDSTIFAKYLQQYNAFANLSLRRSGPTAELVDKQLMEIGLPDSCLVVIIRRDGEFVVPRGSTKLCRGDALTIIGDPPGIQEVRERFDLLSLPKLAKKSAAEAKARPRR